MKVQLEETKQRVDSQKAEQQNLQKIIADADAEQIQQKKQLEQVKKEKKADKMEQRKWILSLFRKLHQIMDCWQNFSQGDQRAWQPGQAAATSQRWACTAVWEDQDPAINPEQRGLSLQQEDGRQPPAQAGDQEAKAQEEHPG